MINENNIKLANVFLKTISEVLLNVISIDWLIIDGAHLIFLWGTTKRKEWDIVYNDKNVNLDFKTSFS